jgi:homoserine O-acetyltransferase
MHNGRDVSYAEVDCSAGHDSFLLDDAHYHAVLGAYLDRIET